MLHAPPICLHKIIIVNNGIDIGILIRYLKNSKVRILIKPTICIDFILSVNFLLQ